MFNAACFETPLGCMTAVVKRDALILLEFVESSEPNLEKPESPIYDRDPLPPSHQLGWEDGWLWGWVGEKKMAARA